jgi:hypothetical protein
MGNNLNGPQIDQNQTRFDQNAIKDVLLSD